MADSCNELLDETNVKVMNTNSKSSSMLKAPEHLNSSGCYIRYVEGKGRGVFASRDIPAHTDIEISPVLLFASQEYEEHGRHTVLDHFTFKWRDGRMALALGLGSLFNHSQLPNVSYKLEPDTESMRYTTTRAIQRDEELCIFYGHNLWFEPADAIDGPSTSTQDTVDDEWGGLSHLQDDDASENTVLPWLDGDPNDLLTEDELPFLRMKLVNDEAEDELSAVQTEPAWVVDIPDPKHTGAMLKWLKLSGLESPVLSHLKRIRKTAEVTTLLLTTLSESPMAPSLPENINFAEPYMVQVPRSAALTPIALKHKTSFWPTIYAPRKKGELEQCSRSYVKWAWEAMRRVTEEAKSVGETGELPIVAYLPIPHDDETQQATQLTEAFVAHDTRLTASHPLRHAVLSLVRRVADFRAQHDAGSPTDSAARNGSHYLLTSLTVFLSHEPCIMCTMALLHSRVKDVFFLTPMEKTGGCGGAACVPKLPGVNHRFGISRWKAGVGIPDIPELAIGQHVDA